MKETFAQFLYITVTLKVSLEMTDIIEVQKAALAVPRWVQYICVVPGTRDAQRLRTSIYPNASTPPLSHTLISQHLELTFYTCARIMEIK